MSGGMVARKITELATACAFFFQAEDGIRDDLVTGVQTCALPISCDGAPLYQFGAMRIFYRSENFDASKRGDFRCPIFPAVGAKKNLLLSVLLLLGMAEIGRASCRERV